MAPKVAPPSLCSPTVAARTRLAGTSLGSSPPGGATDHHNGTARAVSTRVAKCRPPAAAAAALLRAFRIILPRIFQRRLGQALSHHRTQPPTN